MIKRSMKEDEMTAKELAEMVHLLRSQGNPEAAEHLAGASECSFILCNLVREYE